ncbi:hypothetical protein OH76DRAFT_1402076 [Lentinus brumalis]|uniref:Uncharacterized protein n=1 Tax=Lentinus brumalis TaxID=2498619 RepID=A0A371DE78_9APHY|nr:hypothetical protein OH76DRAFT_1402076 [Polyporus brumalis]
MGKLIDYALAQLESLFPSSLAEWDERGSLESRYAIEALNLPGDRTGRDDPRRCCQLDPAVIRNGTTRADGTPERLSRKNIELIARAKQRLKEHGARMIEESRKKFKWSQYCSYTWAFEGCYDVILDLAYMEEEDGKEAWRDGDPLDNTFTGYIDDREDGEDYESREDFADCTGACSTCVEEVRDELAEMRAVVCNDSPAIAGADDEIGGWSMGV